MASTIVVGPFTYDRRNYEPRKGDPPRHDWVRGYNGHRNIVGMEVAMLVDEIERLREGTGG